MEIVKQKTVKPPKFPYDRAKRFGKEKKTLRYTPPRCICNMLRLGTCEYIKISPCQQTDRVKAYVI